LTALNPFAASGFSLLLQYLPIETAIPTHTRADGSLEYFITLQCGHELSAILHCVYSAPSWYTDDARSTAVFQPTTRKHCTRSCQPSRPILQTIERGDRDKLHVSIDEASAHLQPGPDGNQTLRFLLSLWTRDGHLVGGSVSQPIRVVCNNDKPGGAGQLQIECNISFFESPARSQPSSTTRSSEGDYLQRMPESNAHGGNESYGGEHMFTPHLTPSSLQPQPQQAELEEQLDAKTLILSPKHLNLSSRQQPSSDQALLPRQDDGQEHSGFLKDANKASAFSPRVMERSQAAQKHRSRPHVHNAPSRTGSPIYSPNALSNTATNIVSHANQALSNAALHLRAVESSPVSISCATTKDGLHPRKRRCSGAFCSPSKSREPEALCSPTSPGDHYISTDAAGSSDGHPPHTTQASPKTQDVRAPVPLNSRSCRAKQLHARIINACTTSEHAEGDGDSVSLQTRSATEQDFQAKKMMRRADEETSQEAASWKEGQTDGASATGRVDNEQRCAQVLERVPQSDLPEFLDYVQRQVTSFARKMVGKEAGKRGAAGFESLLR
jgi:hypothetical protein